jgi:GNAT superfamily N-acetyltransferase
MHIRSVDSSQIARIGEIDRAELIEVKYRCALAPDGHSIVLLEERMDPPEKVPDWDDEGVRRRAKWWKREVDEGGALFFAEDGDKLAGFAVLGAEKAGKCAEMVALFVDKGHRGKGLGGRLVQRLEDEARQRGLQSIYVQSNETAASVGFYRSVGYRIACLMDASTMWLPGMETSIVLVKRL